MAVTVVQPSGVGRGIAARSVKPLLSIVMLVATILAVLFEVPALATVWQGGVAFEGVDFSEHGPNVVVAAVSDSGLYRRGVRIGQPVNLQGRSQWRAAWPRVGDLLSIETGSGPISVRAARTRPSLSDALVGTASVLIVLGILIFAGVLCYRRPGVLTISFWIFAGTNLNVAWLMNVYSQGPEIVARPVVVLAEAFIGGWAYYPLVWFALRFPDDRITRRSLRFADYLWTVIATAALAWFLFDSARLTFNNSGLTALSFDNAFWRYTVPQNLPSVVALGTFLWIYALSKEAIRQRVLWAIVGFILMIVLEFGGNIAAETGGIVLLANVAFLLAALCPLTLIYGVFRHNLLDISFVINRTLVYALLTGVVVAAVACVDWLVGKYVFESRAALAVEAIATIGVGFALQRVHRLLEQWVDRWIFAGRHNAERHIDRVIGGLSFANTSEAVFQAIVGEPRHVLALAAGAIFVDNGERLTIRSHHDWPASARTTIEQDDPLARLLLSERRLVDIPAAHWRASNSGFSEGILDIAIPLFARNDLIAIAFYGRHRNGSKLDPEEREMLCRLCDTAVRAYEAVQLTQARQELAVARAGTRVAGY